MTRPTFTEARAAVACRQCRAKAGEQCRSLLGKPLNACHPARMDDAIAAIDFLDLETT